MTVVGESIVEFIIIKQKKIYQYIQNWCECFCKMFFGKNDDTSVHFTWPHHVGQVVWTMQTHLLNSNSNRNVTQFLHHASLHYFSVFCR